MMLEIIGKAAEIAQKTVEKMNQASEGMKIKIKELDKPLNECSEIQGNKSPEKKTTADLDKPLNADVDERGFRELTEEEKSQLKADTKGEWSDKIIDGCKINGDGVIQFPCRRSDLANKIHEITGVPYERKIIEAYGRQIEVVMPKFNAVFEAKLPENLYKAKDAEQFKECNRQLYDAIQKNPELKAKFTKEQLKQIEEGIRNGGAPEGYIWHHDAETGSMKLVDSDLHGDTRHTGGKVIWGGGNDFR